VNTFKIAAFALGALACVILLASRLTRRTLAAAFSPFFLEVQIDDHRRLTPQSPVLTEPTKGSYYTEFMGASVYSMDHLKRTGATTRRRMLVLDAETDWSLTQTEKEDELLRGDFGVVTLQKQCFFRGPSSGYPNEIAVIPYYIDPQLSEVPDEIPAIPDPKTSPTSAALVRIFRSSSGHIIATGNYEANGELGSYATGKGEDGDTGPVMIAAGEWSRSPAGKADIKAYGLMTSVNLNEYLNSRKLSLPKVDLPEQTTVVVLVYGDGEFLRVDELKDGSVTSTRFLKPSSTPEEQVLKPTCEAGFEHQRIAGVPTVAAY
jgi:hypothetical protein